MSDHPRADGFQLVTGALALAAGPVWLLWGGPAGWSLLLIVAGVAILSTQWMIVRNVEFETIDRMQIVAALVGLVCIGVAVVYLTRAADDLPALFPGHDGDSEHFRLLRGVLAMMVGLVALIRATASLHLRRP